MVWETLPIISAGQEQDNPAQAIWPFIPSWSHGMLPTNKQGRMISTANARLREEGQPFAPTFMPSWNSDQRVIVIASWFYEFDSRVKPQIPYGVFPTDAPFWMMAGLARRGKFANGSNGFTVTIITVNPNDVLTSIGHNRSPALLRDQEEAVTWLRGSKEEAVTLLRPYENELMGAEQVPMGIKIPGNQDVEVPIDVFSRRSD